MTEKNEDGALAAFNARVAEDHLVGNWVVEPFLATLGDGPKPASAPHLWDWQTVRNHLLETFSVLPETEGARRVLTFLNPALPRGTTHTLSSGIQLIGPGEIATAHSHSMNALRFVIEGDSKLETVVNGIPCPMENYDLILTPSYSLHDHYNGSDGNVSWLDVLDVTLYSRLNQMFFSPHEEPRQAHRNVLLGNGPAWLRPRWGDAQDWPQYRFPWSETYPLLKQLASQGPGSPTDGVMLEYTSPLTGGSLFPTMNCTLQWLHPKQTTRRYRRTSSSIYFAIQGNGTLSVDGRELAWGPHDTFALPNWAWHRFTNTSATEPTILFGVHDEPAIRALSMYRDEVAES